MTENIFNGQFFIIVFNYETAPSFFFQIGLIQIQVIAFWKIAKTVAWHWPLKGGLVSNILKQFSYLPFEVCFFFILSLKSKNTMGWIQRMAVNILFMCNVFCKWIRLQNILYFCIFNYVRGDKQKVWSKAENREQDWRETLRTVSFFSLSPHTPYRCVRLAHFARVRWLSYAKCILRRKLTLRWPCIMQL